MGGVTFQEVSLAIMHAGYELTPVFLNRRIPYSRFKKEHRTGKFLCHQTGHFFAHIGHKPHPGDGIIRSAWKVTKVHRERMSA